MFKRVLAFVCALCLLCGSVFSSYACYNKPGSMTQEEADMTVSYWKQGSVPNDNSIIQPGTDYTIGGAACSHFAMSYMLVKTGYMNVNAGETPINHINLARQYKAFRNPYYFEYGKAPEMYPGIVYHGVDSNVKNLIGQDGLDYVKGKMAEGYYVIACVQARYKPGHIPEGRKKAGITDGHMIFFDGINADGTVSLGDSFFYGTTWEELYGTEGVITTWKYLELLKCDGKPFEQQPSIYDDNALRGVNDEEIIRYKDVVAEYNLTGMPEMSNLAQYCIEPQYPDLDSLMPHEVLNLSAIQSTKEAKELTLGQIVNTVAIFIGVLLVLYAVSLVIGFAFDCVNVFVDVEVIKILTFGYIKVVRDKNDLGTDKKKGYTSVIKLFAIVIVVALIGVLLISGNAVAFLYGLAEGVS